MKNTIDVAQMASSQNHIAKQLELLTAELMRLRHLMERLTYDELRAQEAQPHD